MDRVYKGLASRFQGLLPLKTKGRDAQPRRRLSVADKRPLVMPQPFPGTPNPAAPEPSSFWSPQLKQFPLPTNTAWLNFVLNQGSAPEYLHPYLFALKGGALNICYPSRIVEPAFIIQSFVPNLTISCTNTTYGEHQITSYDDLSVTLTLPGSITVPMVRGCPYVTFIFNEAIVPKFSTIHAILGVTCDENHTKHKIEMNNGQTWLVYSSSPLSLDKNLIVDKQFKGVIRIAFLPSASQAEVILDRFSTTYPLEGHADVSVPFEIVYQWRKSDNGGLLMLSLPIHRDLMSFPGKECVYQDLSYDSIDGKMHAIVSSSWVLHESPIHARWFSLRGISDPSKRKDLANKLRQDVALLAPITTESTYFHGKALARVARLAIIAEEVRCYDALLTTTNFLRNSLTPWMDGSFVGNSFLYDWKWGGLVSQNGSRQPGVDFGFGIYNDHHYHLGYFCYAAAVLAKLDQEWGSKYMPHLYTIVEDFMTTSNYRSKPSKRVSRKRPLFPRFRNFDFWVLHSWAGGLTEFADGRNQESTSEAINAYYSASLLGTTFGDIELTDTALTLAAFEIRSARTLWHIPSNCSIYESKFVSSNRMLGIVWANKRDTGLWFASPDFRECRLGIHVLPLLPITELLFRDVKFVKELVDWASPSLQRADVKDGWKGFFYALQAMYDPECAMHEISTLSEHDDGNSLSNLLWWVYTR